MTKNKIIDRILSDAQAKCNGIVAQAEINAEKITGENDRKLQIDRQNLEALCTENRKEMLKNAMSNAQLEVKKYRLAQKQRFIADAFDAAYKRLAALPASEYANLLFRLLKENAEKGEKVLVAKRDAGIVTQEFLDKLGLKLKLIGTADIDGGVILQGDGYDKDMSLRVLINTAKSNLGTEVAKILFGE